MTASNVQFCYGPVPSRRLGKSLGINNIPAKVCSYSCIYCQVGKTTRMEKDRRSYYEPDIIFRDVQTKVQKAREAAEQVDYLTFVPDGEPTLDVNLGKEITLLKKLEIPVGIIANGSLLWREDVREEIALADWVSVKIDAVRETIWRQINRPHKAMGLSRVLDGIRTFSQRYAGKLVTETMLVGGINDQEECITEVAEFIHALHPATRLAAR